MEYIVVLKLLKPMLGIAMHVCVEIIREANQSEGQEMKAMLRVYDIDTGKGYPQQASAMDLFKESRRQNLDQCRQVMVSDRTSHHNLVKEGSAISEEAKRAVTKLLVEVRRAQNINFILFLHCIYKTITYTGD